jgi:hypothetical protein
VPRTSSGCGVGAGPTAHLATVACSRRAGSMPGSGFSTPSVTSSGATNSVVALRRRYAYRMPSGCCAFAAVNVCRHPRRLGLRLTVRGASAGRHRVHQTGVSYQAGHPSGHPSRRRRVQYPGELWQPLRQGGGVVVDNVVRTRALGERGDGRDGRVGDVQERPDAGCRADQGKLTLPDGLDLSAPARQRGARPIQAPVA